MTYEPKYWTVGGDDDEAIEEAFEEVRQKLDELLEPIAEKIRNRFKKLIDDNVKAALREYIEDGIIWVSWKGREPLIEFCVLSDDWTEDGIVFQATFEEFFQEGLNNEDEDRPEWRLYKAMLDTLSKWREDEKVRDTAKTVKKPRKTKK